MSVLKRPSRRREALDARDAGRHRPRCHRSRRGPAALDEVGHRVGGHPAGGGVVGADVGRDVKARLLGGVRADRAVDVDDRRAVGDTRERLDEVRLADRVDDVAVSCSGRSAPRAWTPGPTCRSRLAAAWTRTSAPVDFAAALTPSFMAAKKGLSRPLIITPTDLSAVGRRRGAAPAVVAPPHAATVSESDAPTCKRDRAVLPTQCRVPEGDTPQHRPGAGRLLELVRTGAADTRVELTRESGLARATVNDVWTCCSKPACFRRTARRRAPAAGAPRRSRSTSASGVVYVADLGASARGPRDLRPRGERARARGHAIDIAAGPDVNLALVRDRLPALLAQAGRTAADVVAVTVGVPGPVQASRRAWCRRRS